MRAWTVALMLAGSAIGRPASAAGILYGAGPGGNLIRIDVGTGAGTLWATFPDLCVASASNAVTEIEFSNLSRRAFAQCGDGDFSGFEFDLAGAAPGPEIPNGRAFTGLEAIGGVWYGSSITAPLGNSDLRTLDPFTGSSTLIGPTGVAGPISGIAYDELSGVVYGIAGGIPPSNLYRLDLTTGAATVIGSTGIQAGSLEFGPDGRLYAGGGGANSGDLFVIDPGTGASTFVGSTGFGTLSGLMLVEPAEPAEPCNVPANPFLNCGFESGSFTSWTTQDHPAPSFALSVGGAGFTPGFGLFASDPAEGSWAALTGFDGGPGSPARIRLAQDVTLPGGGLLEFDYRAGWDIVTSCSPPCADRPFSVQVEPAGGGASLATFDVLTARGSTRVLDTGRQVGRVDLVAFGGQTVRMVFDWFVPEDLTGPAFFQLDNVRVTTPIGFFTVAPCRVIDTRNAAGPLGGPALVAGVDRPFTIAGACGIPASAKAISVNVAVTAPAATGNLRLHPGGTAVPLISSINYAAGQTRSNNAILALSGTGQVAVFPSQASGTVHFIVDVNGYFR